MSHTEILDKIGQPFVNRLGWYYHRGQRLRTWPSTCKDGQESDFDCEGFVNVATQMIAQFFQRADPF